MFFIPYAVALALYVAELSGRLPRRALSMPRLPSGVWVGVLVATYAVQLALVSYGATHGEAYQPWRAHMPLPVIDLAAAHADTLEAAMLLTGLLQTCALVALYTTGCSQAFLIAGVLALLAMSMAAPALTSADVYSNVGYALLGKEAYAPPPRPFATEFWPINAWWGTPMVPSPYGPLWIAIVTAVTAAVPGMLGKILALRALGAFSLAFVAIALRGLGLPRRVLVITLLNPALAMQFVANAHIDAAAVAILACGAASARRFPIAAAASIAVSALIKLPYVVLGLPILIAVKPLPRRIAYGVLAIAAALGISAWVGGSAYLQSLVYHLRVATGYFAWHVAAETIGGLLLIGAMLGLRRLRAGVWLIPPIGSLHPAFVYPWYVIWSFPYALARRRVLAYLLLWFPFVTVLVNQHLMRVWTLLVVFPLTLFVVFGGASKKGTTA